MKKLIYILLTLVFVCTGCTEELGLNGIRDDDGFVLTIHNSPLTKAVTDPGADYERRLNTLDCFFYPNGQTSSPCVFYHRETLPNNTFGEARFTIDIVEDAIRKIFPTDNTCEIFVIANLPSEVIPEGVTLNSDPENIHTRLDSLAKYLLQMRGRQDSSYESNYDDEEKTFVMAGRATGQKDSKKNASATISLRRAASKITFSVAIPEYIIVKDKDGNSIQMTPQLTDDKGVVTFRAAFHNGTSKGYLYQDADAKTQNALFNTEKCRFVFSDRTLPAIPSKVNPSIDSIPKRRVYKCEVPFYTYARTWEKGSSDAAYMAFEMPWGYQKQGEQSIKYDTYYYQILINGNGRTFEPNNWYDLFVNIGVIGSSVENVPIVIDHQVFYVLDWTDEVSGYEHPDEDVLLETYLYFIVNQKQIEVDNKNYCNINYHASHGIKWEVTDAYYYDNSGNTSTQKDIDKANITFNNDKKGVLTLMHDIPSSVYSPIYINLNIWLDLDGNGTLDEIEKDYKEQVSVIQYPAMYVVRDQSNLRSIYINGLRNYNSNDLTNVNLGTSGHPLGCADGVRNFEGNNANTNYSMFIVNVSSFDGNDTFQAPVLKADGCLNIGNGTQGNPPTTPTTQSYKYIIGDPRQRSSDITLDGGDIAGQWATADALYPVDGSTNRKLKYYYPTESFGNSFQVIAPKFRVVSFNNASGKYCTAVSAAMRCASMQEDGYPAGRWRLPTVAEVQYIIYLQGQGAIQPIFSSSSSCYATASYGNTNKTRRITLSLNENNKQLIWNNVAESISVRCVYDDWYWGSEREALENTAAGKQTPGGFYRFTWGDKEITWN